MADFTIGKQPCAAFDPMLEYYGTNVHECLAPFDGGRPRCCESGGLVSFCEGCCKDHHSGGYETCAGRGSR
jgi:hypothetical protein